LFFLCYYSLAQEILQSEVVERLCAMREFNELVLVRVCVCVCV